MTDTELKLFSVLAAYRDGANGQARAEGLGCCIGSNLPTCRLTARLRLATGGGSMRLKMFLLSAGLLAALGLNCSAQTFSTLHTFTNGADGSTPYAGLISVGDTLYGTARGGGSAGKGTVFMVSIDGTGFTTLYSFSNSVGDDPYAGLVLSGSVLYGTTSYGGEAGSYGTVYRVNTDGTGFSPIHSFGPLQSDGAYTKSGLVLSGNTLYGTATEGGNGGYGTVFKLNTNGTGFTVLHRFTPTSWSGSANTNADGANPYAALVVYGDTLYGSACYGGSAGNGAVFKVNTDGTGFEVLHHFTTRAIFTNRDGANPFSGLTLSGDTLYATARTGGAAGYGTVFKLSTNGSNFTTIYSFSSGGDGAYPAAGLLLSGSTLYGAASSGGANNDGTVFRINVDGTGFTTLHSFSGGSDGGFPKAGLVLSGDTLYGTTTLGGSAGHGTVFALKLPAPVSIPLGAQPIPNALVLSWTNSSFWLQSAVMPTGVYTNVPDATSPYTNAFSGHQRFFRLQAN